MELFLYLLLYLFILIVGLLVVIFFIPFVYSIEGVKKDYYFYIVRISWLGKIVNIIINKEENKKMDFFIFFFGLRIPLKLYDNKRVKNKSKKKDIKKQERKRKKKKFSNYFSFFQRSILEKSFLLVKKALGQIFPNKFYLHLVYGFEDPANTGMLTGLFFMLFPNISNSDMIKIYPVFDKEIIQGELNIEGRIIIAVIVYYFFRFYFTEGVRQILIKIRNI